MDKMREQFGEGTGELRVKSAGYGMHGIQR